MGQFAGSEMWRVHGKVSSGSSIRAWSYAKAGAARDVMQLLRLPAPEPALGEVLVETKVSAVNPTDIKRRTTGRELGRFERIIPNNDGAGIIVAVGEAVSAERIGDHVWLFAAQAGRPHGTASSMLAIPSCHRVTQIRELFRRRLHRSACSNRVAWSTGGWARHRQNRSGDRCRRAGRTLWRTDCESSRSKGDCTVTPGKV